MKNKPNMGVTVAIGTAIGAGMFSATNEPVTSLQSSIAEFVTKNPKTERLGFSTTVITCANNFL
ncbi:hypothetical protein OAP91_05205 [Acidimicrobiia bacterium]|nr:hypothetical protein [Acidimicrobiia bacterium]